LDIAASNKLFLTQRYRRIYRM